MAHTRSKNILGIKQDLDNLRSSDENEKKAMEELGVGVE
jgi:hypothetical protein